MAGRLRQYWTNAERQAAYRERRRQETAARAAQAVAYQEELSASFDHLMRAIDTAARCGDGDALALAPHDPSARLSLLARWFEQSAELALQQRHSDRASQR